jgi:hypothetical protein
MNQKMNRQALLFTAAVRQLVKVLHSVKTHVCGTPLQRNQLTLGLDSQLQMIAGAYARKSKGCLYAAVEFT